MGLKELLRVEGTVSPRTRRVALALIFALQTAMFFAVLPLPLRVDRDNVRYEIPGWLCATGRGLSMPDEVANDPEVRSWVCDRHPEACRDGIFPAAMYPPGYSVLVAGVYVVAGRSLVALTIVNWLLLLALFAITEVLAARYLPPLGYGFVVAICMMYPFLAAQATVLMSDSLHATLLLGALGALLLMRPGYARGALFGLLLSAATMTRPYCMFVVPALLLWRPMHRALDLRWREWAVAATACAIPVVAWTARNAYWFGRFIPFSTSGVGVTLYTTAFEIDGGDIYSPEGHARFWNALEASGREPMAFATDQGFLALAEKTFLAHPWRLLLQMVKHAPKLWISLGTDGGGMVPAWPLLVMFLGGLMLLGAVGIWLTRRDARWHALSITVLVNWAFLLPMPGEARRTLPLRMPMLLLGAMTVVHFVRKLRLRQGVSVP